MNNKTYFSKSSILTYESCPQKFKLKYLNKSNRNTEIPNKYFSFDKSIHATMAKFNTLADKNYKTLGTIHDFLEENWISSGYDSIEEENKFKLRGFNMLANYVSNPLDIGTEPLIINKLLRMKINKNFVISAKIDKVYEKADNSIEVVDYKSGTIIDKTLDFHSNIQLPIYLLLVYDALNVCPKSLSYYYLTYNKKITHTVTDKDIEYAWNHLSNIFNQIKEEQLFACSPTPNCKTYCEYFNICNLQGEKQ